MIVLTNRQRARKLDLRLLKKLAAAALDELNIAGAQLGIVLVGAKESALLNEEFLGHEGPTDVITFDYHSPKAPVAGPAGKRPRAAGWIPGTRDAEPAPGLHGEIFICVDEAERQARQFGTTWQEEMVRYVVHGVLHLTGHDDLNTAARRKMKRIEGRLVRELSRRFALSKL